MDRLYHDSYHSEYEDYCPYCRIAELEAENQRLREAAQDFIKLYGNAIGWPETLTKLAALLEEE